MAKVMIVDDDSTTVKLLETLLELEGFEVVTARRGGDVVPLVEQSFPDIILMDYHLTDMDGVDVVRDLRGRAEFADLPIIITSGLNVESEARDAGASMFLLKPFEPDELSGLFKQLIQAS